MCDTVGVCGYMCACVCRCMCVFACMYVCMYVYCVCVWLARVRAHTYCVCSASVNIHSKMKTRASFGIQPWQGHAVACLQYRTTARSCICRPIHVYTLPCILPCIYIYIYIYMRQ